MHLDKMQWGTKDNLPDIIINDMYYMYAYIDIENKRLLMLHRGQSRMENWCAYSDRKIQCNYNDFKQVLLYWINVRLQIIYSHMKY